MALARVMKRGQIVIPASMRSRYGIRPGDPDLRAVGELVRIEWLGP
jgi:AbrB family looped-hinge helix DNA binding protein